MRRRIRPGRTRARRRGPILSRRRLRWPRGPAVIRRSFGVGVSPERPPPPPELHARSRTKNPGSRGSNLCSSLNIGKRRRNLRPVRPVSIVLWTLIALLGAAAFGVLALARGETINAAWLLTEIGRASCRERVYIAGVGGA